MSYLTNKDNPEMMEAMSRIKNTQQYLDKEYTLDELNDEGVEEVVSSFQEAKEEAESLGGKMNIDLEYYPYTKGVRNLEITITVEVDEEDLIK